MSVFDVWIWAAALLAVAAPFLGRLVGSEISSGGKKAPHHGRGFAYFALVFVLLLSVIVTAYDRYRPLYKARFAND